MHATVHGWPYRWHGCARIMVLSIGSLSDLAKLREIFNRDTEKLVTELGEIARVGGL